MSRCEVSVDAKSGRVRAAQWIRSPIGEVFAFFADAHNLERITPPFIGFHVLAVSTPAIGEGTQIDYRLRLHGLPIRWTSRIEDWKPPYFFKDRQIRGPYREWLHEHEFRESDGGTLILDRVRYGLPLDPLGSWIAGRWVAVDIENIFNYRVDRITEILAQGA